MSEASLPYAGTSGHSGTETSRDRAIEADTTGTTNERQQWTLKRLGRGRFPDYGYTVKDLREDTGWHHGVASSVLTNLHIGGHIVRLQEKRDRCHIYVLPEYVDGREVSPYAPNKRNRPEVNTDAIEEEAFTRGYNKGLQDGTSGVEAVATLISPTIVGRIEAYLAQRKAIPTAVAWIDEIEAIIKEERERG